MDNNFNYLLAAYSIIFAVIFLYVMFIWRRQSRLEAELQMLETRLREMRAELTARPGEAPRSVSS